MTRTAVLAVTRAADDPTTAQSTPISQLSWSKSRLIYELQHGLPYRTFPPGIVVDWHDPLVPPHLDMATGTMAAGTIPRVLGVISGEIDADTPTEIGIEVLLPADADGAPLSPEDAQAALALPATAAPDASKARKRGPSARSQRVTEILRKLYPTGLPSKEVIRKATLCRAVEQEWKLTPNPLHIPCPSPDTIERVIDELRRLPSHIS